MLVAGEFLCLVSESLARGFELRLTLSTNPQDLKDFGRAVGTVTFAEVDRNDSGELSLANLANLGARRSS